MTCFKNVLEQNRAKNEFVSAFNNNRLNHAYLLEGKPGIGKNTLARAVAARYLCHTPTDTNDSCGKCNSCKLLSSSTHPDFLELPRDAGELRIRRFTTRQTSGNETIDHPPVLNFMRLKPMLGNGRVCLIPDAERINNEAANAFLKTLEEPPNNSLIILTTSNKDLLLSTINSRCRIICMPPLSPAIIQEQLTANFSVPADSSLEIAELSEGSLGKAESLIKDSILDLWHDISTIKEFKSPADAVRFAGKLSIRIKKCKDSYTKRQTVLLYLDLIALNVRRQMRHSLSALNGYHALNSLWEAAENIHYNVRPELIILNAIIKTVAALNKG